MNKTILKDYVNLNYSTRDIAKETNKSQSTIRYWLKKYKLKTHPSNQKRDISSGKCKCCKCNTIKPLSEFSIKTRDGMPYSYCKDCDCKIKSTKARQFKLDCLDYKNSRSCSNCGYSKSIAALEFHHLNKQEKDFTISNKNNKKVTDEIKYELDKCVVLCANCHREAHDTYFVSG